MQVIFLILLCTGEYNSLGDPTRQDEVWRKILLQADPIERLTACVFEVNTKQNSTIQRIRPNLMRKCPKWNCMVNMIMTVSGRLDYTIYWFTYTVLLEWGVQLFKSFCHIIINEMKCLGFRSPKKGMLISVLSPAGYFFRIRFLFFWRSTLTNYCKHFPKSISREFISPVGYFFSQILLMPPPPTNKRQLLRQILHVSGL